MFIPEKKITLKSRISPVVLAAISVLITTLTARAQPLYWDANGINAGAGTTPAGIWGTDAFWSTDPLGLVATTGWTAGRNAVFSAGSDATGAFSVTLVGTLSAASLLVEEGAVSLTGSGAVAVGTGNIAVNSGNILSIDNAARMTGTGGGTITVNGGTIRNTVGSSAGSFVSSTFVTLTLNGGGTVSYTGANLLNIINATPKITGVGPLTKSGAGVLAIVGTAAGNNDWTGGTIITDGELRVRTANNALPLTTAVTVTSPGILNLNGLSQTIGSLSGSGDVGLASGTLTVGDANNTLLTGNIKDTANAGATGATSVGGKVIKVGTGTLTFGGTNAFTGLLTLSAGGITVNPAAVLSPANGPVTVNGGTLTLNNAGQTIGNLNGSGGSVVLGAGHTLTLNPLANSSYAGSVGGAGGITKVGTFTQTFSGANTYGGATLVNAGTLRVANTTGSGTGSGDVTVASGATLSGPGSAAGQVFVSGTISPGTSPGTMNTGAETWNGAGTYVWEINNATGAQGADPGWDLLNISGALSISANSGNKFILKLTSLTAANAAGNAVNFDNTQEYFWTIATASGGITGFDPAAFSINTSALSNPLAGVLFVEQNGNSIRLHYIPVPTFPVQPASVVACPNAPFAFAATIGGPQPYTNQWQFGVTNNVDGITWTNAPDQTNGILSFAAAVPDQTNYYFQLIVSNAVGAATSSIVRMTLVVDTTPPSINCGQNETLQCGLGWGFTVPIVTDDCASGGIVLNAFSTATNFTCGQHSFVATRVWQASDFSGNVSWCTQVVTVVDTIAPAITQCATNRATPADMSGFALVPDMRGEIVATDCSGSSVVAQSPAPGTMVGVGVHVVTLFASDSCANTNTCTANFQVFAGNAPPSASDKGGVTTVNAPFSILNSKLAAAGTDPDNDPLTLTSVSATSTNGGTVVMGATRVTYTPQPGFTGMDRFSFTLSDGAGGTATANMYVLVVAGTLPSQNQLSLEVVPAGVRVRFAGIPGFSYSVQRAPAASGPWTTLATQAAPVHGLIEYLDTTAPGGSGFYRTVKP